MTVLMLRYHVAENDVQTVIRAVETAFASLKHDHPEGLRFTYYRVAGTPELVGLVELRDGVANPLLELEAMRTLKAVVDGVAIGAPPVPRPLQVIASYGT